MLGTYLVWREWIIWISNFQFQFSQIVVEALSLPPKIDNYYRSE